MQTAKLVSADNHKNICNNGDRGNHGNQKINGKINIYK
jgi:hypothetical protein